MKKLSKDAVRLIARAQRLADKTNRRLAANQSQGAQPEFAFPEALEHQGGGLDDLKELLLEVVADAGVSPKEKPPKPTGKKATVDQCLAALIKDDPTRVGDPARVWAERVSAKLGRTVSPTAVKLTDSWKKTIMTTRAMMKAERVNRDQ